MLKIKTKRESNGDITVYGTYDKGSSVDVMSELSAIIVYVIEHLVEAHQKIGQNEVTEKEYADSLKGFLDFWVKEKKNEKDS